MIQDTFTIFRKLYACLPPLVPEDVCVDMKAALEQLENNPYVTVEELEDIMITFGKKIWPYRKAFHEIVRVYEGKIAEQVLLNILSKEMRKKYSEFMAHGGTYRDFLVGGAASFFSPDERITLSEALVCVKNTVQQHARQAALTVDKMLYLQKIKEFEQVQSEIESVFEQLHSLADAEQEHPELATEIRSHIRGFEYGLAALGPQTCLEDVSASVDYFKERKIYKRICSSCSL